VFEWAGTMLHAKTAVADGLWSRVGSTNLNFASWMTNYEMDVAIDDIAFAAIMTRQYEADLVRSTEIVLTPRNRVRRAALEGSPAGQVKTSRSGGSAGAGSGARAAAGAVSVGSALGAALTNRRTLGPAEASLLFIVSAVAFAVGMIALAWPRIIAWPLAFVALWLAVAWAVKGFALKRKPVRRDDREAASRQPEKERGSNA
jgi:cardiolipin synthase